MTLPYIAIYLAKAFHYDPLQIGLVVAASPIGYVFFSFIGGYLADRFGKKRMMVISLIVMSFFYFAFYLSEKISLLIVINLLIGFSRGSYESSSQSYLADKSHPDDRQLIYNTRYIILNACGALGPFIAVYFAINANKELFLFAAIIFFVIALFIKFIIDESIINPENQIGHNTIAKTLKAIRLDKFLLFLTLTYSLYWIGYAQIETTLPQVLLPQAHGIFIYVALLLTNTVFIVCFQLPFTTIMEKFDRKNLIYLGCVFMVIGFIGFALTQNLILLILSMITITLGEMIILPTGSVIIAKLAPEHLRATYFGVFNMGMLGFGLGPILGGFILDHSNGFFLFNVMAFIYGVELIAFVFLFRTFKDKVIFT